MVAQPGLAKEKVFLLSKQTQPFPSLDRHALAPDRLAQPMRPLQSGHLHGRARGHPVKSARSLLPLFDKLQFGVLRGTRSSDKLKFVEHIIRLEEKRD